MLVSPLTIASAEWSAEISTSPDNAYQGVAFDYNVTIHNNGNATMHVTSISINISWGHDWISVYFPPPYEYYQVFSGDQAIEVGDEHTFRATVTTGFGGMFPTTTLVTAYQEGDLSPTTANITGSISFAPAPPTPPSPIGTAFGLGLFFVIILGSLIWGFFWGKVWWSHEIANALRTKNPDELLRWKWRAYYWEAEGAMWKNYLVWIVGALIFTLLMALIILHD
jgi:hypothetical protein